MFDGPQRQRHGVTKHLVEGVGGLVVGVMAVLIYDALSALERVLMARTGQRR